MKIKDVCAYLESIAPIELQESYDNCGLIVGNKEEPLRGILTSLDCTLEVVEEARKKGCNLIVAHHPIIFSGLKKLNGKNYIEKAVIYAIKNDISIYAAHTNFDNVLNFGVNNALANKLGLKNTQVLDPKSHTLSKLVTFCPVSHTNQVLEALFEAGMGKIGNYDSCSFKINGEGTFRPLEGSNPFVGNKNELTKENETRIEGVFPTYLQFKIVEALKTHHPYEEVAFDVYLLQNQMSGIGAGLIGEFENELEVGEFLNLLKQKLDIKQVRYTAVGEGKKIKKLALCGGSGSFLIKKAMQAGADAYLSADIKYHEFFDAEKQMLIADIGHYETEKHTKQLFFDILSKKFSNFALCLSEINTNPVNYF